MIVIGGSAGEGGGQILRTSLALSLVTGQPFRIERIRARRQKPGLLRQHLTAVEAAKAVGCAEVSGAALNSQTLEFRPGPVTPGNYRFAVGTAGSATPVLQTVLPALLTAHPTELARPMLREKMRRPALCVGMDHLGLSLPVRIAFLTNKGDRKPKPSHGSEASDEPVGRKSLSPGRS